MDLDVQIVDRHPVLNVPIEPVRLLDQENAARGGGLSKEGDHLAECRAAGALGGFDIFELLQNVQSLTVGVLRQQCPLRWDRKALFLFFR